ncbi:TPA: DUF975 family protein [Streptococcus equi subsp. zooepidemicus]|uniref:DUF975 family protein n=1 Tax=Streptococcus equi TaxID=1336 RepID=UPI001E4CC208|nr:DUF975 family protein [Streptococcus equi]MCD3406062.1 DUF975 family protein [Streptococcus equi subsp. zooepidemicus]MDI5901015.1 DUF975 family protein [Streptococcus equi subsp. zooepidemicus]MDI5946192.1 DUF975 family protein [Streptococcus equi subsp. zooepidemicus]MDI5957774.1 DUF975 family protein [Streptococcus equi subsp. zooepidemicus]MDI5960593.1 DUF975 family protein [Streptococcus equi subsp. zooepidemicus]
MSIREIKREARQTLKGLKGKYLLFLVPIILSIFYSGIEVHQTYVTTQGIEVSVGASYFPLIVLIMLTVFTLSAAYTMLEVIRYYRREVSFSEATIAFSGNLFGKVLVLLIIKWLLFVLWSLIWIVGLVILTISSAALLTSYNTGAAVMTPIIFMIVGLVIFIVGLIVYMNRYCAYSMAEYILYDKVKEGTYLGAITAIEESKDMISGYKGKYFLLHLSFIGWFILVILSFGLLYIYVLPYYTTADVTFYHHLKHIHDETELPIDAERLTITSSKEAPSAIS